MALKNYNKQHVTVQGPDGVYLGNELDAISQSIKNLNDSVAPLLVEETNNEGAWTAYTPTVASGTGALGSHSATGRYKQIGKTVFVTMALTIAANGTGAGYITATLPIAPSDIVVFYGRETALSGKTLNNQSSGSTIFVFNYDNSYPGGTGAVLWLSGFYEVA